MKIGLCRQLFYRLPLLVVFAFPWFLHAADAENYFVSKGVYYDQTSSGLPMARTNNGYVFASEVKMSQLGNVTAAQVQVPGGTTEILEVDGDTLKFDKKSNTPSKLESNYPDGLYTLVVTTAHEGTKTLYLGLNGGSYPNAPRIANYTEAQSINANGWFILRWDRFTAGTAADYIQLRIEDSAGKKVFETPDLGDIGALNGAATFAWLEPGTLAPGKTYSATLVFQKIVTRSTTAYPGALGLSYYLARTSFRMVTTTQAAPDVENYILSKGSSHEQTNAWSIIADEGKEYIFSAKVNGAVAGSILSGSLITPSGNSLPLIPSGRDLEYEDISATADLLDSKFQVGAYALNLNLALDGNQQPSLNFIFCPYPPAPRLSSFDPSSKVRAEQDLVIGWDRWNEGTSYDSIEVRIEDSSDGVVFETETDFGDKDTLDGRATQVTVPAGTLKAGESYKGRIVFRKLVALETTGYKGVLGMATYFSRTKFDIDTAPPDVKTFSAGKGIEFVQNSGGTAQLHPATPYVFTAAVVMNDSNTVTGATVTTPLGATRNLTYTGDGETWLFRDGSTSQNAIEAAYPDGNYTLTIHTVHQGTRSVQLPINGFFYPNSPYINNYGSAQSIDPTKSFTIRWDAFAGGTTNDYIYAAVADLGGKIVDDSKRFGSSSAKNGTDTSYKVDAEALPSNTDFRGSVMFLRTLSVNNSGYPGALGYSGLFTRTHFGLSTKLPAAAPVFTKAVLNSTGRMEVTFTSAAGRAYQVLTSTDLRTWSAADTITAAGNETTWVDPSLHPKCYYRIAIAP